MNDFNECGQQSHYTNDDDYLNISTVRHGFPPHEYDPYLDAQDTLSLHKAEPSATTENRMLGYDNEICATNSSDFNHWDDSFDPGQLQPGPHCPDYETPFPTYHEPDAHTLPQTSSVHVPLCSLQSEPHMYVAPATGQSVYTHPALLSPQPLMSLPSPPISNPPTLDNKQHTVIRDNAANRTGNNSPLPKTRTPSPNAANQRGSGPLPPPETVPLGLLNNVQAVSAVERHLELRYIAGNISADAMENIKKRAVKRVCELYSY